MNILTISTVPFRNNGISNVILEFYENISPKYKMDFIFITQPGSNHLERFADRGSKFYVLTNRNSNPLIYMKNLSKILNENEYDIVHIHGNSRTLTTELYVCNSCKIKNKVIHAHSTSTKHPIVHRLLKNKFEKLTQWNLAASMDAGFFLFGKQPFEVLPNGINVDKYSYNKKFRKSLRDNLNIKDEEIVLGHVGSLDKNKNQRYLINLMEEISDEKYRLILIGDGPDRTILEEMISNKGLEDQVILLGRQNNVNEWLSAFDFFVYPSFKEGFGLAVIEAQANGLKCFVSDSIPSETNVTGKVETFDLSKPISNLASKIKANNPREIDSDLMFSKVLDSEFNIKNAVNKLEKYYDRIRMED